MTATTPAPRGQHLQRVPPHDTSTEEHLIGAALLNLEAAQAVATLDGDVWYDQRNGYIAYVIAELVAEGTSVDSGMVAAILRQRGLLDLSGGHERLLHLQINTPVLRPNPKTLELLQTLAAKRQLLSLAAEVVESVYRGTDPHGLIAEMGAAHAAQVTARHTSWEPVNLAATLAGEGIIPAPEILRRADGQALIYPGRTHALNAESESAKTWVALLACVQEIQAGHHVGFIDFEDDEVGITERLLTLGASPAQIVNQFHYIRPDEPIDTSARLHVAQMCDTWNPTLVVIDGVTEALVSTGWKTKENDDIAAFYAALARPIARTGAAVLLLDHVVKDKDQRNNHAIGGQHKKAGITGAAYGLEVIKPFGRGLHGQARLVVQKDRGGHVRPAAQGGRLAGVFHLNSTATSCTAIIVAPDGETTGGVFRPTGYMVKVSRLLEQQGQAMSLRQIRQLVSGTDKFKDAAIACLISEGHITVEIGPRKAQLHRLVRPFIEDDPGTGSTNNAGGHSDDDHLDQAF